MTIVYFVTSLAVIGVGIWLLISANDTAKQGIGGVVSAVTAVGSLLVRLFRAPAEEIKESFIQQAGVEATFISFMTRSGQIRLLFEQSYVKGEMGTEELSTYQRLIADAQDQTAQELTLLRENKSRDLAVRQRPEGI